MYHSHAPPYCVFQDILYELLISHIRYIYLKDFFCVHLYLFKNHPILSLLSTPNSALIFVILLVYLITMVLKNTYCLAQLRNNKLIVRKINLWATSCWFCHIINLMTYCNQFSIHFSVILLVFLITMLLKITYYFAQF